MDILNIEKTPTISTRDVVEPWKESIIKNKWFYLALLICFYMFKQYDLSMSYSVMIISFVFILAFGHLIHRLSHYVEFLKEYNKHKNNINYYVDYICTKSCEFLDFHRVTHHDSSINKTPMNICYEFINNFMLQGGLVVIVIWLYNRFIDNRIILLWALMYATAHNINYVILKPTVHRDHHVHDDTNYGLDIADIIFDTKHDVSDIESHNHIGINLLIITGVIIYISQKFG
jgi:hypothetical protein